MDKVFWWGLTYSDSVPIQNYRLVV